MAVLDLSKVVILTMYFWKNMWRIFSPSGRVEDTLPNNKVDTSCYIDMTLWHVNLPCQIAINKNVAPRKCQQLN